MGEVWTSLLLTWIMCIPYTCTALFFNQSNSLQAGLVMDLQGAGGGHNSLSRAKRGWVWNQMFVLEEFSGPDPILVGRVSTQVFQLSAGY